VFDGKNVFLLFIVRDGWICVNTANPQQLIIFSFCVPLNSKLMFFAPSQFPNYYFFALLKSREKRGLLYSHVCMLKDLNLYGF